MKDKPTQFPIEFVFKRLYKDYKALVAENKRLSAENAELRQRVEEYSVGNEALILAQKEELYKQLKKSVAGCQKRIGKLKEELKRAEK